MTQSREGERMRFRNRMSSLDCAFHSKHCKFTADLNFKSFITLLVLDSVFSDNRFILYSRFPLKSNFYLETSRFTCMISGTVCTLLYSYNKRLLTFTRAEHINLLVLDYVRVFMYPYNTLFKNCQKCQIVTISKHLS